MLIKFASTASDNSWLEVLEFTDDINQLQASKAVQKSCFVVSLTRAIIQSTKIFCKLGAYFG